MERTSENADHTIDRGFDVECVCLDAISLGGWHGRQSSSLASLSPHADSGGRGDLSAMLCGLVADTSIWSRSSALGHLLQALAGLGGQTVAHIVTFNSYQGSTLVTI